VLFLQSNSDKGQTPSVLWIIGTCPWWPDCTR